MDKKKTHKRNNKPKRAMESDSNNNSTTTIEDDDGAQIQTGRKPIIRIAGAQLEATSTDTMTRKDLSEERSSSSGHSLHMSSSIEKTKHVSFEDLSEEKSGSTSTQSKSSESSLQNEHSAKDITTSNVEGIIMPTTISKTTLRKRKKNAKRRAKKIENQATSQKEESAKKPIKVSEHDEPTTSETAKATQENETKLRFSDEVLQIVERPITGREGTATNTTSARQRQLEIADGTFVPENVEIAARFKQIMDMFDNFTKNLESLEMPPSPRGADVVGAQALTKKVHKKPVIPLGWKGDDISCNLGSNIDISITEHVDKDKDYGMKEVLVGQTAVKDIKFEAQTEKVKLEKTALPKAELREAAVLPTIPQKCEVKDWQTGVAHSAVKGFVQAVQDPKTLQTIAKEKMAEDSNIQKDNFQDVPTSDISIHEIHAEPTQNAAEVTKESNIQEISFKVQAAPALVEIKIMPEAPKIIDTAEAAAKKTEQFHAGDKEFKIDKNLKQDKVEVTTIKGTISKESTPADSGDSTKTPPKPIVNDSTDFVIEMEGNENPQRDFLTEEFEIWKMHHNIYPTGLPKWRQGLQNLASVSVKKVEKQQTKEAAVPAMLIQKDIATSTVPEDSAIEAELTELTCQTVSCQTSLHLHVATATSGAAKDITTTANAAANLVDSHVDEPTSNAIMQNTTETDCKVETYLVMPPPDENKTCAALGPSISRQALVKESPSLMDLPRVMTVTQQPERTFHTIHIDTTSTPSPSVMQRPPLGQRCWTVITDLFNAICVCLQVNKDCIFCLGFFIAFVVSASFLTAFFYRTLSISPQIIHPQQQHAHVQTVSAHGNNMYYY